jgi:hypothetical protein
MSKPSSALRRRRSATFALFALSAVTASLYVEVHAQEASGKPAPRPVPRLADGHISFSGPPGEIGNWEGGSTSLFVGTKKEPLETKTKGLSTNLTIDKVPFKPWARALFDYRQATLLKDEPHTRCLPSGAGRFIQNPYGLEILRLPDSQEVMIIATGGAHTWRVVRMYRHSHPADLKPTPLGDSIGHWEGDTLVIDTVGYNERFWMTRLGTPHTHWLHTIERLSRPSFGQLRYELTVDDKGAYTKTWSGGWNLHWVSGNEPFDYLCQENNLDTRRMIGPQVKAHQ